MSDMGRCATCRWWDGVSNDPYETEKFGRGICQLTHQYREVPDHPESLALAFDHERYEAELWTRSNFGCVQWQAKEPNE